MAFPIIAYLSMLRLSTSIVTASSTASGYTIADIYDMRGFKIWKAGTTVKPITIDIDSGVGTEANADYIALVNHNLQTIGAATVKVMADTFFPPTTQRMAATAITTPSNASVAYLAFTAPGALRYWRIELTTALGAFLLAPYIGEIFMGMKTTLPEYLSASFDPFFSQVEVAGQRSEGGHFLGATARGKTHRGTLTFGGDAGIVRSFYTSDINAFLDNHAFLRKPFFFIVDTADTDFSVPRYIRMTDDGGASRLAVGGAWSRLALGLDVEGAYMEPAS